MSIERKFFGKIDYLSLDNTKSLKGVLAICVFLSHFWGVLAASNLDTQGVFWQTFGRVCTLLGYLSVALFFFLSGYGLMTQYQKRGNNYLKGFLLTRVLPLYLVYIVFVFFYWGANTLLGQTVSTKQLLQSFLFGETIISKRWYFQAILVWYVLFYFSFRFVKKDNVKIMLLIVSFVFYLALCLVMKLPSTWYEGCFCIIIGVLWAKFKDKIDNFLSMKKYLLFLFFTLIAFLITLIFGNFSILQNAIGIISKCISACTFVVLVVLIMKLLPINNLLTRFLGNLYLEIYLLHGFFLSLYFSKFIEINNPWLYGVLVLVSTLILAFLIHPGVKIILGLGNKIKVKKYGKEN
ncbi:MAG: acyltransferase [Clostridia bacterium]|nr:acyltransferase [Clostridia bacterium]